MMTRPASRRRGQQRLESFEAVVLADGDALLRIRRNREHGIGEQLDVGRMQLEEPQAVRRAQLAQREQRRAGVAAQLAVRVVGTHGGDVIGEQRRQIGAFPEPADAVLVFGMGLRPAAVEAVAAGAGMGVDHPVGLVLLVEVVEHCQQYRVLEDVGVVAGVENVAVTEHGGRLEWVTMNDTAPPPSASPPRPKIRVVRRAEAALPLAQPVAESPSGVRVSKLLAERGLCSRREADAYIERGLVYVNGEQVTQLGTRTTPDAEITLATAAQAQQARLATILLHKPIGYVSGQAEDGHQPAVMLVGPQQPDGRRRAEAFPRLPERPGAGRPARHRLDRAC